MTDPDGEAGGGGAPGPAGPDPAGIVPADPVDQRAADLASEIAEERRPAQRWRLAESFVAVARSGARAAGRGVRATRRRLNAGADWLAAQVLALAPRLRVRDRAALQAQFPGQTPEEIAHALIEGSARASAAIGGAIGAWAALPALPAFPVEVATETLTLVLIEIKLVAELHEAFGLAATGTAADRMTAYVGAWAHRRGVFAVPGGLVLAAGSPLARRLRRRLAARAGRSAFSFGPLLSGAAAGVVLNRRETRRLGEEVLADLRRRVQAGGGPALP